MFEGAGRWVLGLRCVETVYEVILLDGCLPLSTDYERLLFERLLCALTLYPQVCIIQTL